MPEPARTIVYRHACTCDTASTPPADEHRFDVDGKPFPFLIDDAGATFQRLDPLTSIYICEVMIIDVDPKTMEYIGIRVDSGWPEIGGKPFPWSIFDYTVCFTPAHQMNLTVAFLAESVDTDTLIANRWHQEALNDVLLAYQAFAPQSEPDPNWQQPPKRTARQQLRAWRYRRTRIIHQWIHDHLTHANCDY